MKMKLNVFFLVSFMSCTSTIFAHIDAYCQKNNSNLDIYNNQGCCGALDSDVDETISCSPKTNKAIIYPTTGTGSSSYNYSIKGQIGGTTTQNYHVSCSPTAGETNGSPPKSVSAHCTTSEIWCYPSADAPTTTTELYFLCYNWNSAGTSNHVDIDNVDCSSTSSSSETVNYHLDGCAAGSALSNN